MSEQNTIYSNGFRVAIGAFEAQISFKLETPVIDEASNDVTGVTLQEVADIRLNPVLAKHLCVCLQQQISLYEQQFGPLADMEPISAMEDSNE